MAEVRNLLFASPTHATQLAAAGSLIALPGTGVNDITFTQEANGQK